jgi:hypothetical protein
MWAIWSKITVEGQTTGHKMGHHNTDSAGPPRIGPRLRKATQNELIYQNIYYHGDAATGIPSRESMLVHGKNIYPNLYDNKADVVTADDEDCLTPTMLCLKREFHRSNKNCIAGSVIMVAVLERN